jgi:hypothetical protein
MGRDAPKPGMVQAHLEILLPMQPARRLRQEGAIDALVILSL